MAGILGYVAKEGESYTLKSFEKYPTAIYSEFNSTSYVVYELTDYIYDLKKNSANQNTFVISCYDYALNLATYEIELPDEFTDFYFAEQADGLTLNPNETYTLSPIVYPSGEWSELLQYNSSNAAVARIVNNKIIAVATGNTVISARDPISKQIVASFELHVRASDEPGYVLYDKPVADVFKLDGFYVNKAYYQLSSEDRTIGTTGTDCDSGYLVKTYNDGQSITRGAARIVYGKHDIDGDGVFEFGEHHVFYTYNHYNDFQEYLNYYGGWGETFGNITGGGTLSSKSDYNPTPYVYVIWESLSNEVHIAAVYFYDPKRYMAFAA
jgi:hypothetical protein